MPRQLVLDKNEEYEEKKIALPVFLSPTTKTTPSERLGFRRSPEKWPSAQIRPCYALQLSMMVSMILLLDWYFERHSLMTQLWAMDVKQPVRVARRGGAGCHLVTALFHIRFSSSRSLVMSIDLRVDSTPLEGLLVVATDLLRALSESSFSRSLHMRNFPFDDFFFNGSSWIIVEAGGVFVFTQRGPI